MKNPQYATFKTEGLKELLQSIYDISLPTANQTKQYPNITAIITNLAYIHREDKEAILDLQRQKSPPVRGTAKAAPANWVAPPKTEQATGASVASSKEPCEFCPEDEEGGHPETKTTEGEVNTKTALPPEVLQAPPTKEAPFNPETAKLREADTAEKMLKMHGKGQLSNREVKERLIATAKMVESDHTETVNIKWNHKRLAQYIVDSMKPIQ